MLPHLPVELLQSEKSVTPPLETLLGTTAAEQFSSHVAILGTSTPPSLPGLVVRPGVSVVASQFTKVTTLWPGSSKVNWPLVSGTGLLAARLSSGDVTHGVSVSMVLPLRMNFWFTVLALLLMAMIARRVPSRYASV